VTGRVGAVQPLVNPHPLGPMLPGLYQEDEVDRHTGRVRPNFAQRFTAALDDVLAPIFSCLDNTDAYFDPWLAPDDFLNWLATWIGLELDENWPLERRRALVARAVSLYHRRGTVRGLIDEVEIFTGVEPEVLDNGGVRWATSPGAAPPGEPEPRLTVRIRTADPANVDVTRLDALVAAARPANVPAAVEVVQE
jgi:phage tail-like protein